MANSSYKSNDGNYTARDNTRVGSVPGYGLIPSESKGPIQHRIDVTEGPMGYIPFLGDGLQAWQAKIDYDNGDVLSAGIGAGTLLMPPALSKFLRKTKPTWGPWVRKGLNYGMDKASSLSPRVRAFLDKYVSGLEGELSKADVERVRKTVLDYQQRRDLEKAPLLPGIENDLPNYIEAKNIKVVPATNRENIINRLGLTETNSGLMRAGALNNGKRIVVFPGNANSEILGHEFRHSIQDEFDGSTLPVPVGNTNMAGFSIPKYDFLPLARLPLDTNPELDGVRSLLKQYNPNSSWHQKITELDAEVERARQKFHPNTTWKELYDRGDERLDKSLGFIRDRFHLRDNDEANYLMKTLYDNGYANGGRFIHAPKYNNGTARFMELLDDYASMLYNPYEPSVPEVSVPVRYEPQPHYGLYEYPASTGMAEVYPITTSGMVSAPVVASEPEEVVDDLFSEEAMARRALKQRYAESNFDNKAKSHAGAMGAWQIMPIAYKDYLGRWRGKAGDLNDPEYNRKVRDWVMGILPRDLQDLYSENDAPRVKLAKIYGAYNWGAGNMRKYLRKQRDAGVDISNDTSWVEGLNPETKRYIKYLALDEDIPDSTYTNKAFEEAAAKRRYMAKGGRLFDGGGDTRNPNEIRPGESIAEWKRRITKRGVSRKSLFNREKVLNRVAGDGQTFDDSNGGVTTSVFQYLFNDDNFVNNRIKTAELGAEKYKDILTSGDYDLIYKTFRDLPEEEQKVFDAGRMEIPIKQHEDAKRIYLGYPPKYGTMEPSRYRPTIGKSENPYQVNPLMTDGEFNNLILPLYTQWKTGIGPEVPIMSGYMKIGTKHAPRVEGVGNVALARNLPYISDATISEGFDKNGQYISLYDVWDYNTNLISTPGDNIGKWIGGKPFEIYQRYYLDDWLDIPGEERGNPYIAPAYIEAQKADGGKIHIAPSKRGTFTAAAKKHGKSVQAFASQVLANKENYSPAMVKKANFARNARKWHGDGGFLDNYYDDGGPYGVIPLDGDYLTYLQTVPKVSGGMIEPSVVTAALPAKFHGSQKAARRYAEGYQKGARPVTEALNRTGKDIFNAVDTVVGFTPTPAGAITWLGHMGADAAEGEYGKVAKDVGLAAAMGLGLRAVGRGATFLKNYWDEIGNFGEDTFRAFTDRIPGRVSTNFTYSAPTARAAMEAVPAAAKAASAPYEIENLGGGYMLKSLMRGNPLEKQISKNGTVNVNNVRALVGKGSKVEQAVVDKVLASEEFAGKKSIDYNKFRKAVQDELITYDRTPDTRWSNYGMGRIGQGMDGSPNARRAVLDAKTHMDRFNAIDVYGTPTERSSVRNLTFDLREGKISGSEYDEKFNSIYNGFSDRIVGNATPETFIFSSSRIPSGSSKHYDRNTLGHSRTYTTADEPDVLHVMESQSDWAQTGGGKKNSFLPKEEWEELIADKEKELSALERSPEPEDKFGWEALERIGKIDKLKIDIADAKIQRDNANRSWAEQVSYLGNDYTSRQIQENLRYAAEKGQTKMRYPTRETAAKIEGYTKGEAYFDEAGNDITNTGESLYTIGDENEKKLSDVKSKLKDYSDRFKIYLSPDGRFSWGSELTDPAITQLEEAIPRRKAAYEGWKASHPNSSSQAALKKIEAMEQTLQERLDTRKEIKSLIAERDRLQKIKPTLKPGITRKEIYTAAGDKETAETILHKYDAFPKQYKKLYKNADVRIVTDPKGNTWYEVDVPENYLKQEWAYEEGGSMILPKMMMSKYSPDKLRSAIRKIRQK